MAGRTSIHWILAALAALVMISSISAQPGARPEHQSPTQAAGGRGGGSANGSAGETGSTANSTRPGSPLNPPNTRQSDSSDPSSRSMPFLFVSGNVVLEDGTPPPAGAVIERVCHGSTTREAYVDSGGWFGFQFGAPGTSIQGVSDTGINTDWNTRRRPSATTTGTRAVTFSNLVGCEIRANLSGYRSSSVILTEVQPAGTLELGTILLFPAEKVQGTLVSATSLMAPKSAQKLLSQAQKELEKKKLRDAEKHLMKALEAFPRYAAALYLLGMAHEGMNRLPQARGDFARALEVDAKYVKPYIELAHLAAVERNWQETSDLSEQALALDPLDFPQAYYLHALANYNLKRFDPAERSARKALRLDPYHRLPGISLILASISIHKGNVPAAIAELRNYLQYAPHARDAEQVRSRILELEKIQSAAIRK